MAPEDMEALAAIEKLINKKLERVLVAGFANAGTVATMVSDNGGGRSRQRPQRMPDRPQQQRKSPHSNSQHGSPQQSTPQRSTPQHGNSQPRAAQKNSDPIFSKPYEPGVVPLAAKSPAEPASTLAKRRERPVAALLGGLKR